MTDQKVRAVKLCPETVYRPGRSWAAAVPVSDRGWAVKVDIGPKPRERACTLVRCRAAICRPVEGTVFGTDFPSRPYRGPSVETPPMTVHGQFPPNCDKLCLKMARGRERCFHKHGKFSNGAQLKLTSWVGELLKL